MPKHICAYCRCEAWGHSDGLKLIVECPHCGTLTMRVLPAVRGYLREGVFVATRDDEDEDEDDDWDDPWWDEEE